MSFAAGARVEPGDIDEAVARARGAPAHGRARSRPGGVGDASPTRGTKANGTWAAATRLRLTPRFHVVAYDFGVKRNILRMLASRGCRVTVVPAQTSAADALALSPDGIFLSNGPGDPEPCDYAIRATRALIDKGLPTFGICLGHQILALASGAKTFKMKFGHHGANHPVKDLDSGRVVDHQPEPRLRGRREVAAGDAAADARVAVRRHAARAWRAPTGRRSASRATRRRSPGPHDIGYLFDRFVALMEKR